MNRPSVDECRQEGIVGKSHDNPDTEVQLAPQVRGARRAVTQLDPSAGQRPASAGGSRARPHPRASRAPSRRPAMRCDAMPARPFPSRSKCSTTVSESTSGSAREFPWSRLRVSARNLGAEALHTGRDGSFPSTRSDPVDPREKAYEEGSPLFVPIDGRGTRQGWALGFLARWVCIWEVHEVSPASGAFG